jgi:zinc/manganese transport system ATP-binding protein
MIDSAGPVRIDSATFGYGRVPAVDGVTLDIPRGQFLALLGPNGSGKSTLLSQLAGVIRPTAGTIVGVPDRVAFVVQRSAVPDRLPLTVRDTVAMGRWAVRGPWARLGRADRALIDESMQRLGLTDLRGRRLASLSGGQRQRALLAQALAQQAPLLLLDEPEAGLDSDARSWITAAVDAEVGRGVTVVVATHDVRTAAGSRRCVLVRSGRVVGDGPPDRILTGDSFARTFLSGVGAEGSGSDQSGSPTTGPRIERVPSRHTTSPVRPGREPNHEAAAGPSA